MKKINLLSVGILLLSLSVMNPFANEQAPNVYLQKCIGGKGEECIMNMIKLKNGNYLSCGYTNSHDGDFTATSGGLDAFLMKTDDTGKIIWKYTYGGIKDEVFYNITEMANGDIIAIGTAGSDMISAPGLTSKQSTGHHGSPEKDDVWLVKTNSAGELIKQKCFGGNGSESTFDLGMTEGLVIDKNGNLLFAGETNSNDGDVHGNHGDYDVWIVKLNAAFDTIKTKTIGGPHYDAAVNIHQINGDFFVTGITASINLSNPHIDIEPYSDGFAAKLDPSSLDTLWYKKYGGSSSEFCNASVISQDSQLVLTGHASSSDGDCVGNNGFNTWTWKIDTSDGRIIWKKFIGIPNDTSSAFNLIATKDGGFVAVGGIFHASKTFLPDAYAIKINANGDTAWTKRFGGSDLDQILGGVEENNGSLLLGGWTSSTDGGVIGLHIGGPPVSNRYHRYPTGSRNGPQPDAWLVELSPN